VVNVPVTPFHLPAAYFIYKANRRLALPGLVVGSMFPDLEIPVMVLLFSESLPTDFVLHSLLGATLAGTGLSVWSIGCLE